MSDFKFRIVKGNKVKPTKSLPPAPDPLKALKGKPGVFHDPNTGEKLLGTVEGSTKDGLLSVALSLPNSMGLLVKSSSLVEVKKEEFTPIGAMVEMDKDVRRWDATAKVAKDGKKFTEIKDSDDNTLDYRNVKFEGYASTFVGTTPEDRDGDYIMDGAFNSTLKSFRENPVLLTNHMRRVENHMGSFSKISVNQTGLAVTGNITNSMHPDAVHTRALVAEGHLKTLSIGGLFFYADDFRGIEEIELMEISLVTVPANPDAQVQVRELDAEVASKAFKRFTKKNGGELRLKTA